MSEPHDRLTPRDWQALFADYWPVIAFVAVSVPTEILRRRRDRERVSHR